MTMDDVKSMMVEEDFFAPQKRDVQVPYFMVTCYCDSQTNRYTNVTIAVKFNEDDKYVVTEAYKPTHDNLFDSSVISRVMCLLQKQGQGKCHVDVRARCSR